MSLNNRILWLYPVISFSYNLLMERLLTKPEVTVLNNACYPRRLLLRRMVTPMSKRTDLGRLSAQLGTVHSEQF